MYDRVAEQILQIDFLGNYQIEIALNDWVSGSVRDLVNNVVTGWMAITGRTKHSQFS